MYKEYRQKAQQEISLASAGSPIVGMQSIIFDKDDDGNPKRITSTGESYPVGGLRLIAESGNIGWGLARPRDNHGQIGDDSVDLTIFSSTVGVGATGTRSIAIGVDSIASANHGTSIGSGLLPTSMLALGKFNVGTVSNLLEIGGGNIGSRYNLMEMNNEFTLSLPNTRLDSIVNAKDVITLEKLEDYAKPKVDYDEHTFAIKGDIKDNTYPGFIPYIPLNTTKKVVGIRFHTKSGTCIVDLLEYDNLTSYPILEDVNIPTGTIGSQLWSDPADYYNLTNGRRVGLSIKNSSSCTDLSVTVVLANE